MSKQQSNKLLNVILKNGGKKHIIFKKHLGKLPPTKKFITELIGKLTQHIHEHIHKKALRGLPVRAALYVLKNDLIEQVVFTEYF